MSYLTKYTTFWACLCSVGGTCNISWDSIWLLNKHKISFAPKTATVAEFVVVTLVLSCTVSEMLHFFVLLTPALFHPNFGDVPVARIVCVGVNVSRVLSYPVMNLFSKYSNEIWTLQTDGQTTYCRMTALCIASRGKKHSGDNISTASQQHRSDVVSCLVVRCRWHRRLCR